MLELNKMSKLKRIEKEYYISFSEYIENCGYNYVYGVINIKWKKCKEYLEKKGLMEEDYRNEIICGLIKDWSKIDYERGSVKTFINMNINKHHLTIIRYFNAEKREINENSFLYLNETNENDEFKGSTFDEIIKSSDDIELEFNENNVIDNIINLLKNENHKRSFKLYLEGYSYTQISEILKQKGINRTYTSIRSDVTLARKFLNERFTPFSLMERI